MERFLDFYFKKEAKLLPLFLNESFRAMAVSFLSLFSAIYIYKMAFSLISQRNVVLAVVFVYFLGLYGFKFLSNLFAEELALKLGLKRQIYFGLFFLALCVTLLTLSTKWPFLLFFASPFWGLSTGFYWFGRHGLMVKMGRDGAFGKQLGMVGLMKTLLLLGAPFLGGLLIAFGGYNTLFLTALFFILLSALSIKPIRGEKTHYDTSLAEVLKLFKTHKRMVLAYMGNSAAATIYGVGIPLYLFLILKRELSLGGFFSLSMVLVALINLAIGHWIDLKGKKGLVTYGSIFQFFVWLGRGLTQNIGTLFIFDIIDRLTGGMVGMPLEVLSYEKALGGHSTGRATLFREIAITSGSILVCCLLIFLTMLGVKLQLCFFLAALFSLFPLLIIKRSSLR